MRVGRRSFLQATLGSLISPALASCSLFPRKLVPFCPNNPEIANPDTPLTIDVHGHVFNGSDLQVKQFIDLVVSRQDDTIARSAKLFGGVLQQLAWEHAPSARREIKALRELQTSIGQCTPGVHGNYLADLKQDGYALARTELNVALDRSEAQFRAAPGTAAPPGTAFAQAAIRSLPPTYGEYVRKRQAPGAMDAAPGAADVAGLIAFVVQNFQYRYVSVHDYLRTFSRGTARKIDLLIANLVDYDWWLAKGRSTPSSLGDQVQVMAQIAIATGGRVHSFVPFDPFREVMARRAGGSSLPSIRDAVVVHGAMGVKLYPPMGFAPYGNAGAAIWKGKHWLPDAAFGDQFGRELDSVLAEFLGWCIEEGVPIMAHANKSNGPDDSFEELALADRWKLALERLDRAPNRKLHVNFGHFGDTKPATDGSTRSEAFVALMKANPTDPGSMAFADASYFSDVLDNAIKLQEILERLYLAPQDRPALLADRLMYGSDWLMSLIERNVETYLSGFEAMYSRIEANLQSRDSAFGGLADKFFGRNAIAFLGLARGERTRQRIAHFYQVNGVPDPQWMNKVDKL